MKIKKTKNAFKEIAIHILIGVIAAAVGYFIPVPNLRHTVPSIFMSGAIFITYVFYAIYSAIKKSKTSKI